MAKNDEAIKALLTKVEEQTAALGTRPRAAWRTNGVFKFNKEDYFNINVECLESRLAGAMGFLLHRQETLSKGYRALHLPDQELIWGGYTAAEWQADFLMRISIITYNDKKRVLTETERKLHGLVSEEARTEMELEAIAKTLSE